MAGSCNSSSFLSVGNDLILEPSGQEREDEVTDFYFLVRKLVAALHCRAGGTGVEGRPPPHFLAEIKVKHVPLNGYCFMTCAQYQ